MLNDHASELLRYVLNGLVATAVHYGVFVFMLETWRFPSAAIASVMAALVGIAISFMGCRYFVFREMQGTFLQQFPRFIALYASIALLHGLVLLIWSDWFGMDYRMGFLIATGLQVMLSYFGNKILVFKA